MDYLVKFESCKSTVSACKEHRTKELGVPEGTQKASSGAAAGAPWALERSRPWEQSIQ